MMVNQIFRRLIALFFLMWATAIGGGAALAGGVVSSADPRATEAGREILRAGGSAADAAMAMMLALTVVEPQSSGIGGGGFLVHHTGRTGRIDTVDGRETAPASARPDQFTVSGGGAMPFLQAFPGGRSVGVPGNIRLMALTHHKWGRLAWARLFDPAIRLADQGFTVNRMLAAALARTPDFWASFPPARALYWQDGRPKQAGDTVRNPDLAALLRRMAAQGPDAFYKGAHAQAMIAAVKGSPVNPAAFTQRDLDRYRAKFRPAVCGQYRAYRICSMGPPSSGATTVLQILGMLERFDMKRLGARNPQSWHLIGEAMRLAYADRDMWLGDSDFVKVPLSGLLDRPYLAQRSALIDPDRARGVYEAGTPPGAPARTAAPSGEVPSTTHFVAIDQWGDIASMTSTVEGPFGSQLIASGLFLNNELTDFSFSPTRDGAPAANAVAPGKRPLSSMSPTIVYGPDGKPILALGSAGGKRIIMHVAKTLIAVLDWDMPVAEAIAQPNLFFGGQGLMVERQSWLGQDPALLSRYGHLVVSADLGSKVNAAQWTGQIWQGAADPRSEGNYAEVD